MAENNVILSIKGLQAYIDAEPETIELVTEGRLEKQGKNGFTISYEETELTGLEGTLTTFQVEKNRITLMRQGLINSQMVFEQGRRHLSMYDTPQGSLAVGIDTKRMCSKMSGKGGNIEIDYAIEIDHAVAGQNFFQIDIRKKAEKVSS